jgi:kynureninase
MGKGTASDMAALEQRAHDLDAADPLRALRDRFVPTAGAGIVSYLDGNSLGRPPRTTPERLDRFVREEWAAA